MILVEYNEAKLKGALMKYLRTPDVLPRSFVMLRHEDKIIAGHPDISAHGGGWSTWIEAKHANPTFSSRGIQELTMLRLARATRAVYLIWYEDKHHENRETLIVEPTFMNVWQDRTIVRAPGFDHKLVARFIRETHV